MRENPVLFLARCVLAFAVGLNLLGGLRVPCADLSAADSLSCGKAASQPVPGRNRSGEEESSPAPGLLEESDSDDDPERAKWGHAARIADALLRTRASGNVHVSDLFKIGVLECSGSRSPPA